ncbi:MAG: anion permease [Oscillospiraceae bacterium]|nr:anion permease [Oscillospiraceae bacterium]
MSAIRSFVRREPVLMIAAFAAAVSCFFVPPDKTYLSYIDFRTLALLYALMTVVAGLRGAGLFSHLAHTLCKKAANVRVIGLILVLLSFFSAMLITNDVALLTFVPFAVVVLGLADRRSDLVRIVVLQTVAANLGSMLTPVGNPQNLYLYSFYDLSFADFVRTTLPLWGLSLVLVVLGCLTLSSAPLHIFLGEEPGMDGRALALYLALFVLCLLVVLRVLSWPVMLLVMLAVLLLLDRKILLKADFLLLLTFVAFFIFSGNLARVGAVDRLLRGLLAGREYLVSLLASQVISNVPAALLLSGFTGASKALLLGVNVGGLGTPIASLASLISMKLYSHSEHAHTGRYLADFTVINVLLLLLLSVFVRFTAL